MSHNRESLVSVPVVGLVPFASGRPQRALATSFRINASVKSAPEMFPTFRGAISVTAREKEGAGYTGEFKGRSEGCRGEGS